LERSYATQIIVFDAAGKYVTTIGRKGAGPGEFGGVAAVHVSAGDTIHAYDFSNSRKSVFSPSLEFIRSVPMEVPPSFVSGLTLPDGRAVINMTIATPARIGLPLHLFGVDGHIVRSFGSENGIARPDIENLTRRALSPATSTTVWSAHRSSYIIDLVDIRTGQITRRLVRRVGWFRPAAPQPVPVAEPQEPSPRINSIRQAPDGLLWVSIVVADARWRSSVRATEPGHFAIADNRLYLDTVIEIIDPERATLVATFRLDESPGDFIGPDLIQRADSLADGSPILRISRVGLQRR
jgi:hypothetical protein